MRRLALAAVLCLSACRSEDSEVPPEPLPVLTEIPPIVVTAPHSFSMLAPGLVQDGVYEYTWTCDADQANLTIAGITGGTIRIEITDETGTQVHDNRIEGGLGGVLSAMTSPEGKAGLWTLRFTCSYVTSIGSIDIHADLLDQPDAIELTGAFTLQSSFVYQARWSDGCGKVAIGSTLTYGIVHVRLWDGNGDLVLSCTDAGTYVGSTSGVSTHGAAGIWTIRIDVAAVATAGSLTIEHP